MAKIRLGKTKRNPKTEDAELKVLQKLLEEKEQPSFKKYLLERDYSLQTIKSFEVAVQRYQRWLTKENLPEISVSYNDMLHYIQSLRNTIKQRSIQTELNSIKHYYNYLQQIGQVDSNPTIQVQIKGVKRRTLHNVFTKQELDKLYKDYKELPAIRGNYEARKLSRKRNEVILSLLIYQGLNTTELSRVTISDIQLREGKLFIKSTRRSNERTLQLESHQVLDIMEYTLQTREQLVAMTKKETNLLFISIGASPDLHNVITKLMRQLKQLNSKVTSLNQLRTSVITNWLRIYNLRETQYMAGHRYVSSTEAYLINDLEDLHEQIDKYHPIG